MEIKEEIIHAIQRLYFLLGIITLTGGLIILLCVKPIQLFLLDTGVFRQSYAYRIFFTTILISFALISVGCLEIASWFYSRKVDKHNINTLIISALWLFGTAPVGLVVCIIGFTLNEPLLHYVFSNYGEYLTYVSFEQVYVVVLFLEIVLFVDVMRAFACAFGLAVQNEKVWKFTVYYHYFYFWTVIDFFIARFLSADSVKIYFNKK